MIDETTRRAVMAALFVIDSDFPQANKSAGPLGDTLATNLHQIIRNAIMNHLSESR